MKKLLLLLVVFVVGSVGAFAFDILSYPPPVEGGNILVDVGLGFTGAEYGDISVPPLRASVEYALPVGVPISVGGFFAFHRNTYETFAGEWAWNHLTIAARANWHWGFDVSWFDLYTGLMLGYTINSLSFDAKSGYASLSSYYEDLYADDSHFLFSFQLGSHFYFTKIVGAFVEFGYPYWANVGIALKF
jgi:hypothetical protein